MRKAILPSVKASFPVVAGFFLMMTMSVHVQAQQYVINQKDQTRPEANIPVVQPSKDVTLSVQRNGYYNDVQWQVLRGQGVRSFTVEYSFDEKDYLAAGNPVNQGGVYKLRHYVQDTTARFYRLKVETANGQFVYTEPVLAGNKMIKPVKVYPTVVTGDVVNVVADLPVERIVITAGNGTQAVVRDVNGKRDFIPVQIPSLGKGMYLITFYGKDWRQTDKFMIE